MHNNNTHSHKADITLSRGVIFIEVSAKTLVVVDDDYMWNPVIFTVLAQFGVSTHKFDNAYIWKETQHCLWLWMLLLYKMLL